MTVEEEAAIPNTPPDARWAFLRDVAVFQFKLFLNNLHNFFQIPLTLVVAAIDVIFKTEPEGERFYKTLEYGRMIDDSIDIYSVIAHREKSLNKDFTVDAVVSQLEGVIAKEVQKGGSAASMKAALDKAIDAMQAKADEGKAHAKDAMQKAADAMARGQKPDGDQA
jgi:ribosome-associated translation inhibitor RaiA